MGGAAIAGRRRLGRRLRRAFFERGTVAVARGLLGKLLVHDSPRGRTVGRIVETEAYLRDDPASHSFRGRTRRNASMFGPPGRAYVYFVYGMHHCVNVVTAPESVGEAVLLRALEPVEGVELMRARRRGVADRDLCNGPGKLVRAMGIGRAHDGADLVHGALGIREDAGAGRESVRIVSARRVGVSRGVNRKLRFFLRYGV